MESRSITEVFTGFGVKGVTSEKVARRCVGLVNAYLSADVPVGRFLADQLLVPMAMAGSGRFFTEPLSLHTTTNIEIIKQFLDVDITSKQIDTRQWEVRIES